MVEVAALTTGCNVPAARFRVRQYIGHLEKLGVNVQEYCPSIDAYSDMPGRLARLNTRKYFPPLYGVWAALRLGTRIPGIIKSYGKDVIWLQREFQAGVPTFELVIRSPFVFDVDDAIWLKPPFGKALAASAARRADLTIVGNEYLADWFSQYARDIEIVPTAVDTNRFVPVRRESNGGSSGFVFGWIGTSSGFPFLYMIESALDRIFKKYDDVVLLVVADKPPRMEHVPADRVLFKRWSKDNEVSDIQSFDAGIMPLTDDEWSRGKCAFKVLQYMATGIPFIASPVGMNVNVAQHLGGRCYLPRDIDEWFEAMEACIVDRDKFAGWGNYARKIAVSKYSTAVISRQLADIFQRFG